MKADLDISTLGQRLLLLSQYLRIISFRQRKNLERKVAAYDQPDVQKYHYPQPVTSYLQSAPESNQTIMLP